MNIKILPNTHCVYNLLNVHYSGLEIASGDVYSDTTKPTILTLLDNVTVTNDNYFPIVIDTLNISLAISWVGGVQFEVR